MKDRIANTLVELMKTTRYADISIRMLCDATPVSRNAFYYHFESKQQLLEWACIRNYQKYCLPYHKFTEGGVSSKTMFEYILRFKDFYKSIYDVDGGVLLHHCFMVAHISGTDVEHVKEYTTLLNSAVRKINKEVYLRYATSGLASVLVYWVENDCSIPIEAIAKDLQVMLTIPLTDVRDKYVY